MGSGQLVGEGEGGRGGGGWVVVVVGGWEGEEGVCCARVPAVLQPAPAFDGGCGVWDGRSRADCHERPSPTVPVCCTRSVGSLRQSPGMMAGWLSAARFCTHPWCETDKEGGAAVVWGVCGLTRCHAKVGSLGRVVAHD